MGISFDINKDPAHCSWLIRKEDCKMKKPICRSDYGGENVDWNNNHQSIHHNTLLKEKEGRNAPKKKDYELIQSLMIFIFAGMGMFGVAFFFHAILVDTAFPDDISTFLKHLLIGVVLMTPIGIFISTAKSKY